MAALDYVGATPANPADLTHKGYVGTVTAGNMTQTTVTSLLNTGFASNVLKSYVDAQDALNATAAFIDAGDAAKLHLSQLGVNSGVVGLDSSGRIEASRINVASLQRWPKPFISPSAYQASPVTSTGAEAQLFTMAVADPGFTYKLLLTGSFDATTTVDGTYPIVRVRQGSTTGQVVGQGFGLGESYGGGITGTRTSLTTAGTTSFTTPAAGSVANLDIVCLGGGAAGNINGGGAGTYAHTTLTSWPTSLSVTVGAGGVFFGAAAAASTMSGTGVTTVSGAAGAVNGSVDTNGASPGNLSLHGQTYVGGAISTGNGNPPGAGGSTSGGSGAPGAVWFYAWDSSPAASGPLGVVPYPLNLQAPLTGATTLYVMVSPATTGSVTVSTLRPALIAIPVPA